MKNSKLQMVLKITLSILTLALGITLILLAYFFQKDIGKAWTYVLNILGAVISFVGVCLVYNLFKHKKHNLTVKQMTMVAVQSAITVILYYFVKFNLPIFPPWLDIQVSEIPALITAFAYGPYAGCLVIFIRFIIKLPATITAGVGEFGDLILGVVLVLVSSLIYHRNKNLKNALIGTSLGVLCATILALFVNWLILIPAYINIAKFPLDALVGMLDSYIPYTVNESNFMVTYILVGVLPFNIVRYILVSVITFILYKKIHFLLDKITK